MSSAWIALASALLVQELPPAAAPPGAPVLEAGRSAPGTPAHTEAQQPPLIPSPTHTASPARVPIPAPAAPALSSPPNEPTLTELRAAATALALAEPARARSMVRRARAAAWLPEVRLRADRRMTRTEKLDYGDTSTDTGPPPPVSLSATDDAHYEWRATWDLSKIVFNPDELHAHAEALRMADVRREIETAVIRLYFERRRLQAELSLPERGSPAPDGRRMLRIREIEAELDALSGGLFSKRAHVGSIPGQAAALDQ